jgi:8-hydroxy-5-deazaflavin:NADPH oxidoreductase
MNIAIIGSGNVGKSLGSGLARAGHDVTLSSRTTDHAAAAAAQIGVQAADSLTEAVAQADVVVLAVPGTQALDVARVIAPEAKGKIVIDATNPIKPDRSGLFTEGTSTAEELATVLDGAAVVKGFNTLFGSVQAQPDKLGTQLDALFATDDERARDTFAALAAGLGFRPVKVGPLAAARELEAMAWLNIRLQMISNGSWRSSFVLVGAPEDATRTPDKIAA